MATEGDLALQVEYAINGLNLAHKNLIKEYPQHIKTKKDLPMTHPANTFSSVHRCPKCMWRLFVSHDFTWCESEYCDYAERLTNGE